MTAHRLTIRWSAGPSLTSGKDTVTDTWILLGTLNNAAVAAFLTSQASGKILAWNMGSQVRQVCDQLIKSPIDYLALDYDSASGINGGNGVEVSIVGGKLTAGLWFRTSAKGVALPVVLECERVEVWEIGEAV